MARDLAAEFHDEHTGIGGADGSKKTQFEKGNTPSNFKDPVTGKFLPGNSGVPGAGRKKGSTNESVKAIKEFMVELLNDSHYRNGLVRRIKAGELPGVELFLLTKALGKPKEEIEITGNVPLFALPASFVMKEDVVESESVKVLEEGDADGGNSVRE